MKLPMLSRAVAVAAIALAILFPVGLIKGKVAERQARADGVIQQFAAETSRPQVVTGPFLAFTCEETYLEDRQVMRGGKAETVEESKTRSCPTLYVAPKTFKADASMPVESRHRGIYPIQLYRADVHLAGTFEWPAAPLAVGRAQRAWKHAYAVIAVSDPRGIKAIASGFTQAMLAPVPERSLAAFAVREDLGDYGTRQGGTALPFDYRMTLLGTSSLHVAPVGDATEIRIASDWPHPAFGEAWTPDERRIGSDGFEATWRITSLATGGQAAWQAWSQSEKPASVRAAGASLFDPVNVYSLSYRATEYAFLFVLFTFGALGFAEVVAGVRLHPVQYALTGSAIAVFFLLLLALSEHIAFAHAYAVAATACIALLTFYLRYPLGSATRTAAFVALFVALYGTLYGLLKSEDNALLMGSVMVFALLALAMLATRRVDWSTLSARMAAARG